MDLGVDSLDVPKFIDTLNAWLRPHHELEKTIIFNQPSVTDLAKHICEEVDKLTHVQPSSNEGNQIHGTNYFLINKPVGIPETVEECEAKVCEALDALRYGEKAAWTLERKRASFMDLGVDSLDVPKFIGSINAWLRPHHELGHTIIFEQPSVTDLAKHLYQLLIPEIALLMLCRPPPPAPKLPPGQKYDFSRGMQPWRNCSLLDTHKLEMAQAQAKGTVTMEMIEDALANYSS